MMPRFQRVYPRCGRPHGQFPRPRLQKTAGQSGRLCRSAVPVPHALSRICMGDHSDYLALLRKLRASPGVKKVFIRSGIRYDYMAVRPLR